MPVTLTVANHAAQRWAWPKAATTEKLLQGSCPEDYLRTKRVIQSSVDKRTLHEKHITPSQHGFVWSVYHAYSDHHRLTLRPEDVWFSVLSQLSFFVNEHAEEVRSFFVPHQGQEQLQVFGSGIIETADFGALSVCMTQAMEKHVVDPELRTWIMPAFSTTTASDRVVAAVLMMGALQKYFSYQMVLRCGIPSVTLLGERDDWASMVTKLNKIPQLGAEPAEFAHLLRPVLEGFVASFDSPSSVQVCDFWGKYAHESGGSGPRYLSGWITAFCFWGNEGQSLYHSGTAGCELDGIRFHQIEMGDIPGGFASVPVKIDDNGTVYETKMVSGMVGIQASSKDEEDGQDQPSEPLLDSIQPISGWWMYELMGQKDKKPKRRAVECQADVKRQDDAKRYRMTKLPWRPEETKA